MNTIHVHLVGPALNIPGGVSTYCGLMAENMETPPTYHVVGQRASEGGALASGVRILADCLAFCRGLRIGEADIIHFNPSLNARALVRDGLLLQLARFSRARKVVFIHGWDAETYKLLCHPLLKMIFLSAFKRADCFIVLSKEHRDALMELGVRVPIHVDTVAVADDAGRTEPAEARYEASLLFLSRIESAKGVFEAISAHRLLVERGVRVHLNIAGDGPDLAQARRFVDQHEVPRVSFLGHVAGDAKHAAFSDASIFLFPTRYGEGLPTCVLEAMTYGLPVLTTPVGGIRDFFENGRMGFLSTDTRPEVLANLLQKMIDNPGLMVEMSRYNQRFAKDRFTASSVSRRLHEIYRSVM